MRGVQGVSETATDVAQVARGRERSPVRRRAAQFALLLVLSTVLHIPALVGRLFSSDEASLASMAMVIDDGGTLYHQTADRKPPVVPYIYAAVFKITGSRDLRPVRALGVIVLASPLIRALAVSVLTSQAQLPPVGCIGTKSLLSPAYI